MKRISIIASAFIISALFLSACSGNNPWRQATAKRVASAAFMIERNIPAGIFSLKAFERMHERNAPAHIYIEGDGSVDDTPDTFLGDVTAWSQNDPRNPVTLQLAARDNAVNLAYLARPCQHSGMLGPDASCDPKYFTEEAYSGAVLAAYHEALDKIKNRYGITTYHLIGFEGGGTIAAILAATRDDVISLRTVAANLNHAVYAAHNNQTQYSRSLSALDFSQHLSRIPQVHFVGGNDTAVPVSIIQEYLQSLGPTNCAKAELIQEAQHEHGWDQKWPELLRIEPTCRGPVKEITQPAAYISEPRIHSRRELPDKP